MKQLENPIEFCVVLPDNRRTFELFQSFVVALAKSQDHREFYGVFALVATQCGTSVAVCGIPRYTSKLKRGRWAKNRAEWFGRKFKKSVQCDAMTWLQRGSYPQAQANFGFDHGKAVLCSNNHQRGNHENVR
jgi:hypothetical protein